MTIIDDRRTTICPDWCQHQDELAHDDPHPDTHESRSSRIALSRTEHLFVSLVTDAYDEQHGLSTPDVAVWKGDDAALRVPAAHARSLAAALINAANVAERSQ